MTALKYARLVPLMCEPDIYYRPIMEVMRDWVNPRPFPVTGGVGERMKKLPAERELRKYCNDVCSRGDIPGIMQQAVFSDQITALVRAVREECAKVTEDYDKELVLSGRKIPFRFYTAKIAAAIRSRK